MGLLIRKGRWRIAKVLSLRKFHPLIKALNRMQFSLRSLFFLTTLAAMYFSAVTYFGFLETTRTAVPLLWGAGIVYFLFQPGKKTEAVVSIGAMLSLILQDRFFGGRGEISAIFIVCFVSAFVLWAFFAFHAVKKRNFPNRVLGLLSACFICSPNMLSFFSGILERVVYLLTAESLSNKFDPFLFIIKILWE